MYAEIRRLQGGKKWHRGQERGVAMEAPKEAPKKISTARKLIGPILLIAATAVAVLEFRAFFAADRAVKRLESAQDEDRKNKSLSTISKERVRALVGREPIAPGEKDGMYEKEIYVWQGLIRKYRLTTFYEGGDEPRMVNFSTE
jgi:hypothetical protein